ncbi:hypothetical protein [Deinococcus roseus]|uniref:Uncharacterized protein n=1 Tax=Deinococcus roseus TaxID=392414 RepID=A0ABQ2D3C4_9DEIO|nr:hypothetical protein [Deinococcus roseus]GGJ44467.1 hypothetical protein GCM10008938_33340 [Deinococcus roseus]
MVKPPRRAMNFDLLGLASQTAEGDAPAPSQAKERLHTYLDVDLKTELAVHAAKKKKPLYVLLNEAVKAFLDWAEPRLQAGLPLPKGPEWKLGRFQSYLYPDLNDRMRNYAALVHTDLDIYELISLATDRYLHPERYVND